MQPSRQGTVVVLRRPIGNRATPKVCGVMPTRVHATMLVQQLEKAESVVKDLFMEATDDGIEALEAVLAACREEVMKKGPRVPPPRAAREGERDGAAAAAQVEERTAAFDDRDIVAEGESGGDEDEDDVDPYADPDRGLTPGSDPGV